MALDDTSATDLGNGGGQELTKVSKAATSFVAAWAMQSDSEDAETLEIAYEAWDALQAEQSICSSDVLAKLAAFRFRYDQIPITYDIICEGDVEFIDTLVTEALATLRVLNGMAE